MYILLFLVGLIGFVAMSVLGALHGVGGGHHAIGGAHGHSAALGHSHGSGAHPHLPGHGAQANPSASQNQNSGLSRPLAQTGEPNFWVSPLDLFSLALGGGATGLLLQSVLAATALPFASVLGAIVFCVGIVRPLISTLSNFASRPSQGLEGMVAKGAVAATKFDRKGRGLVTLTLDGQNIQVLALLEPDEVDRGVLVAKGDPVTIIQVDSTRNTCRVTRELAA